MEFEIYLESPGQAIYKLRNSTRENFSAILLRRNFFTTSDISKEKFHLIVDEYDGETLSHNEIENIRKLLKGGNFVS